MTDGEAISLPTLVERVADLRPLGSVATRTLKLTDGDRFSAHELAQVVASDPALTSKLLRLANSAYYGFPRRISTVRDAVVLLGFRAVRSATIASAIIDAMPGAQLLRSRDFWHFSVTVGMLAEVLARADREHHDEAFTAGVLHNVGRLALDQHLPWGLRESLALAQREGTPLHEAERILLGYTDADLGGALAERWNFPPELIEAVRCHQWPLDAIANPRSLAAQVIRAREFAYSYGLSDGIPATAAQSPIEAADYWTLPTIAQSLTQSGGVAGVLERVDAFLEHTLA